MARLFASLLFTVLLPAVAGAQGARAPLGDPAAGADLAREVCASCHAVSAGDRSSPVDGATPFAVIAGTPGMTERAITVWLTTFHPERTMPGIVLSRDEREDVIAHILSLEED